MKKLKTMLSIVLPLFIITVFVFSWTKSCQEKPKAPKKELVSEKKSEAEVSQSFTKEYFLVKGRTLRIYIPDGYDFQIYGNNKLYYLNAYGKTPVLAGTGKYVDLGKNISQMELNYYNEEGLITVLFIKR